jgi:hypothetical protein
VDEREKSVVQISICLSTLTFFRLLDNLGQLGIPGKTELKDFVVHPFFVEEQEHALKPRYQVLDLFCKRSSTFVFCSSS